MHTARLRIVSLIMTVVLFLQFLPVLAIAEGNDALDASLKNIDAYEVVNPNTIPRSWEGEYDGHHDDSTVVRRMYEMHILTLSDDGEIHGKAIFAPSPDADEYYGANGSYFFSGRIDMNSGKIDLQGYEWIDYPNNFDNWGFVILSGYFDFSSGAHIHGHSEDGIWEMTAIDYGSIDIDSGFTLGTDNNSYVHTSSEKWAGAGFAGVTNYTIAEDYFTRLTSNSGRGERNAMRERMRRPWNGSCYGIAMTMGLLFEEYIDLADLTDSSTPDSYYSLDYPCNDDKLLNMINYFQLSQFLENGGKEDAAVSIAHNYQFFSGFLNWINGYDSLSVFLKKLVNYCVNNHVELLGFSTESSGHAILVTGCEFDEASDSYKLKLYDENCINSAGSLGEFTYMTVSKDFSSFSFTDAKGDIVNETTYVSIYFLDWDALGSIVRSLPSKTTDGLRISFPLGTSFRLENEFGQYLQCNDGAMEGTIPIVSLITEDNDINPRLIVETGCSEKLYITNLGSDVDIEVFDNSMYTAFSATSADSALIDMQTGISLYGTNFQFKAFVTTENANNEDGMISVAGDAKTDITLSANGSSLDVFSEMPVQNVITESYIGVELLSNQYSELPEQFTVMSDASVTGEDPVPPTDEPVPPTDEPVPPTDEPVPPTGEPASSAEPIETSAPAVPATGTVSLASIGIVTTAIGAVTVLFRKKEDK